jgi:hypothetical protein
MFFLNWLDRGRVRYGLALGEGFLLAARSNNRTRRNHSVTASRLEIPPELVSVSVIEPNIRGVSKFAQLAGEALQTVGGVGKRIALVLPDMAIRAFVFPRKTRTTRAELAGQIAPRLSYPEQEAHVDTWSSPSGTLVAAVRRAVLRQYEQALEALGCHVAWVDGASLIGIPEWVGSPSGEGSDGLRILVQLYARHYALSVLRQGELLDIRTKLRGRGDDPRVVEQLSRLPTIFDGAPIREVTVQGEGARALAEQLDGYGLSIEPSVIGNDGEEAHLTYALGLLLRRS